MRVRLKVKTNFGEKDEIVDISDVDAIILVRMDLAEEMDVVRIKRIGSETFNKDAHSR